MVDFNEYTLLSEMPVLEITYEKSFKNYNYLKFIDVKIYELIELDES